MKRREEGISYIFIVIVLISLIIVFGSSATFAGMFDNIKSPLGGSKGDSKSVSSSVSRSDLDSLYTMVSDADNLLQKSVRITFKMLGNKDELQKMELRRKEADNIKDPKEKEAELYKIHQEEAASVQKSLDEKETSQKVQNLDAEQKALLAKAIYNTVLAGLRDKDAVEKATQISQKIQSNPLASTSYAGDLPKLKDIVTKVPPQADKAINLGNGLSKLAQANKIEVALPKSSSEKVKEVDIP
jgi:hypothetical protein